MPGMGLLDVRILAGGVANGGRIDGRVLEGPGLAKAGTGRILDCLASLQERGMITLNGDKSFQVTDAARSHLWDRGVPLWGRVLRLLDAGSLELDGICESLAEGRDGVEECLGRLRRSQLVLMSARHTGDGPRKMYEITSEGVAALERAGEDGFAEPDAGKVGELLSELEDGIRGGASADSLLARTAAIRSRLGL